MRRRVLVVYGFDGSSIEASFLNKLTQGKVECTERINASNMMCRIDTHSRDLCGPFAGVNLSLNEIEFLSTFILQEDANPTRVIMRLGEMPFFVFLTVGGTDIFLLGVNRVSDIDESLHKSASLLTHFVGLVPFMVCIRYILKERCWVNDSPRACFIIDDPLLRKEYGFINYRALYEALKSRKFHTSVAFIPWNCRRTSKKVAAFFLSHPDMYSLSIHGCDHNAAEFGSTDEILLRYKAVKAMERMRTHQRLSGLPFDEVIVFPQGVFSTIAMKELKSCHYLAAVNSTPYPVDVEDDALTLRGLLDVAVTRFSNFPLFVRHYPKNIAELAFDLFLGKPALLVEHHGYFRNGYGALIEFVDKLNSLEERLEWTTLAKICSSTCLKRVAENGDIHVQFYADRFWLQNDTDRLQNYLLFRRGVSDATVTNLTINGRHIDYEQETDTIKIPLVLNPRKVAEVRVTRVIYDKASIPYRQSRISDSKVLVRRFLSECRDNYVDKSFLLSSAISNVRRLFQRSKHLTSSMLRGKYSE
jgi:hypothetical protein